MKAETIFSMPLLVVVALWLLRRRAAKRSAKSKVIQAEPVNFGEELAVYEHIEALLLDSGATWLDRALLWAISGRRMDAARLAKFNWMVIGVIPKQVSGKPETMSDERERT